MKFKSTVLIVLIYLFGYSNLPAYSLDRQFAPYDINNDNVIDGYDWNYYSYSDKIAIIKLNYLYSYIIGNKKSPSVEKIAQDIKFLLIFCNYHYSNQANLNKSIGLIVATFIFKADK